MLTRLTKSIISLSPTVKIEDLDSFYMLVSTIKTNNNDLINLLIAASTKSSLGDENKIIALHYIVSKNNLTIFLRLLNLSCGVNVRDDKLTGRQE